MSQSYQQELLPQFPWQEDSRPDQGETNLGFEEDQEDKIQLWKEMETLELPEVDAEEIMCLSWFYQH